MGAAPESDIVLVQTPITDVSVFDGISYIFDYAQSVGKPCVINMSLGKHTGPHDGTSFFDQACDSKIGEGKILVGANGNSGEDKIHVNKLFTTNDTIIFCGLINNGTSKALTIIDVWGEVGKDFKLAVNILNKNTNFWEDSTPYISAKSGNIFSGSIYDKKISPDSCIVNIFSGIDPRNNKPGTYIEIDNSKQKDNYRYAVVEIIGKNTQIHMWNCVGGNTFSSLGYNLPFLDGSTNSTVAEMGGTGKNIISVGAYTSKNTWLDLSNSSHDYLTSIGEIASFSSKGPTVDGRMKPDITAPGNVIVSSVNSYDLDNFSTSSDKTVYGISNGSHNWFYGVMQGTSMAAPMVTGIIANWLQANPKLTPSNIKTILQKTSIIDTYYGDANTWGYGKINALSGLAEAINMGLNMQSVIITQVYGGGGNSGANYKSDFIELYNTTNTDINIGGCCLYYIAATSSSTTLKYEIPANSIIKANSYFLIKGGDGTGTQPAWNVAFDASCTLNMSGSAGKVILLKSNSVFTLSSSPTIEEIINNADFMDYVPYGTSAIPMWGSAMVTNTTNTTAARRKLVNGSYQYTKNIGNDFEVVTAEPHNSSITTGSKFIDENMINVFVIAKMLYFKGVEYNQKVEIFNTTGLMIHSTKLITNSIPLNELSSGIYIVRVGKKSFKIKL